MKAGMPDAQWDAQLKTLHGSVLQSQIWAEVQAQLGYETFYDSGKDWLWLASKRKARGITYLLAAYGPVAHSAAAQKQALHSLIQAGKSEGVDFVRIEPQLYADEKRLNSIGARKIGEFDPEYTQVIDLRLDVSELRSALSSGHRNRVNGTERRGITVRSFTDDATFQLFLSMLHDTAARSKVTFFDDSYYQTLRKVFGKHDAMTLYVAEYEGEPVSAAMFYDLNGTRYYAHAGAFQEQNRKLKTSVSLVWQALIDAKTAGLTTLDLWGVGPEGDKHHHLAGLSEFKRAFGGSQVKYGGSWDIPLNKAKYHVYAMYRKLRGLA